MIVRFKVLVVIIFRYVFNFPRHHHVLSWSKTVLTYYSDSYQTQKLQKVSCFALFSISFDFYKSSLLDEMRSSKLVKWGELYSAIVSKPNHNLTKEDDIVSIHWTNQDLMKENFGKT